MNVYKNDIELKKSVYPEVRDSTEARKLGEKENANIVIWGSIEKTYVEAEIIPRLTIVRPLGKMKLEARQLEPTIKISIAELDHIDFKKRKAREITDVVLFILGFAKYDFEKYQEAIAVFESIQNKNAETFFSLGNCYAFLKKPDLLKATEAYQSAIEEDSNFVKAYYNWGTALNSLGRHEDAIERFKQTVRINPKYGNAYCNWGVALYELGKYEDAIKKFKEATLIDPNDAETYCNWGGVLGSLGQHAEAIEKYKVAVRINPNDADAYSNWGVALGGLGRCEEAIEKYKKAIQLNPKNEKAYLNWGVTLGNLGRHDEAMEKFKQAIQIDPNYAKAHDNIGITLMILGRKEEAKGKFLRAKELFKRQGRDKDVKEVEGLLKELERKRSTDRTD